MKSFTCALAGLAVFATALSAQTAKPTIYVIGDSTASNANHRGWADPFADYFDASKVNVVNRARAGRSSRTFVTEGLWDKVRDQLQPAITCSFSSATTMAVRRISRRHADPCTARAMNRRK